MLAGAALGIGGAAAGLLSAADATQPAEDVSAVEDLMREHGVLRRILLVYEECLRRLRAGGTFSTSILLDSATLVRKFVEDYHEKLEEQYLFPEFERHEKLRAAREDVERATCGRPQADRHDARALAGHFDGSRRIAAESVAACEAFIRMYRPHAAREDTVLFPAFKGILSAKQLDELGDKFEDEENRRFGAEGFEQTVEKVAAIEKELRYLRPRPVHAEDGEVAMADDSSENRRTDGDAPGGDPFVAGRFNSRSGRCSWSHSWLRCSARLWRRLRGSRCCWPSRR